MTEKTVRKMFAFYSFIFLWIMALSANMAIAQNSILGIFSFGVAGYLLGRFFESYKVAVKVIQELDKKETVLSAENQAIKEISDLIELMRKEEKRNK